MYRYCYTGFNEHLRVCKKSITDIARMIPFFFVLFLLHCLENDPISRVLERLEGREEKSEKQQSLMMRHLIFFVAGILSKHGFVT